MSNQDNLHSLYFTLQLKKKENLSDILVRQLLMLVFLMPLSVIFNCNLLFLRFHYYPPKTADDYLQDFKSGHQSRITTRESHYFAKV